MEVNPAIFKGVAHIAQDGIILRRDRGHDGRLGELGFEAAREAVDQAFELFHLGDEGIAALGQFMLNGGLDGFGAGADDVDPFGGVARRALNTFDALINFAVGTAAGDQNMDLGENHRGDRTARDRQRQADSCIRIYTIADAAAYRDIEQEQDKSHSVSTQFFPSTLTNRPHWLTNCVEMA